MFRTFLLASAVAALSAPAFGQDESTTQMSDVPLAAMAAARAIAGVDEFKSVGVDLDGGSATYELATTSDDGKALEVDVLEDGTVEEVEYQVDLETVPEKVTTLLRKYFPEMEPTLIERSVRGDFVTFYEFEGSVDGQELDVEVREDGRQIVIQEDAAA